MIDHLNTTRNIMNIAGCSFLCWPPLDNSSPQHTPPSNINNNILDITAQEHIRIPRANDHIRHPRTCTAPDNLLRTTHLLLADSTQRASYPLPRGA